LAWAFAQRYEATMRGLKKQRRMQVILLAVVALALSAS
jgi:hypothetical protein